MSKSAGQVCELDEATLISVLKFLAADEVATFCSYLDHRIWEAGEILIDDGLPIDFVGFVLDGKVALKKETGFPGRYTLVAILERCAMIGEISAVEQGVSTATVVALQKTEILLLTGDNLKRLIAAEPTLSIKLLKHITHVLSLRLGCAYARLSSLL